MAAAGLRVRGTSLRVDGLVAWESGLNSIAARVIYEFVAIKNIAISVRIRSTKTATTLHFPPPAGPVGNHD
jgi:hypothetical protein